jgi:hypothetical protein
MDRRSRIIGDRARECALSAGAGSECGKAHKRGKACAFGALYWEVSYNSIVQMINGHLV